MSDDVKLTAMPYGATGIWVTASLGESKQSILLSPRSPGWWKRWRINLLKKRVLRIQADVDFLKQCIEEEMKRFGVEPEVWEHRDPPPPPPKPTPNRYNNP